MRHSMFSAKSKNRFLLFLAGIWIALFVISLSVGSVSIPVFKILYSSLAGVSGQEEDFLTFSYILLQVRMPRVVLCGITGISLGISGCIMQTLFRNPLASPFTMGVSSGASFGAALAMVLGVGLFSKNLLFTGYYMVAVNAFLFGLLSLLIVTVVARFSHNDMGTLILVGTAISSLFSAGVSALKYISNAEALKNLEIWLMGGFWGANWKAVTLLLPVVLLCIAVMLKMAWDFNAVNAGEDVAASLGVNFRQLKGIALCLVTLVSSITIAFAGIIGFVGLVAPHIARSLVGTDNRKLIPCSCMTGSILLLFSDTLARTVIAPREIPVGIVTSVIGVPFFIFILVRRKKQVWG